MLDLVLNWGDFLYFPEDKSTYIPAFIKLCIMIIVCVIVFKVVRNISAKEAEKAKLIEQEMIKKHVNPSPKTEDKSE